MNKQTYKKLSLIGLSAGIFAQPILHLFLGVALAALQNLFGASIERQSISFDTDDPHLFSR